MRLGGRILGAMTLVSAESLRVLNEFDVELAGDVGARAAVAIENARIYSERSSIARTLQQNLLPEELPAVPGYELASLYVPAVETTLVGGDFYDVWQVADGWMVIVGDVTGKGIDAAALTALVRHTMRAASEFRRSPAALLEIVDSTLKKRSTTSVCTALCMRLEGDRVTLAVGGHPPPLLLAEHEIRELDAHGPLLGAFADVCWQDFQFTLEPATTLVVYTDGITDTLSEDGVRFGLGRLFGALEPLGVSPAADVIAGLSGSLGRFQAVAHNDDTAALVVRRLAADAGCESVIASTTVGSTAANASTARTSA
jgi:serine phosphatase RsbU (regulator of sigma subunit)